MLQWQAAHSKPQAKGTRAALEIIMIHRLAARLGATYKLYALALKCHFLLAELGLALAAGWGAPTPKTESWEDLSGVLSDFS